MTGTHKPIIAVHGGAGTVPKEHGKQLLEGVGKSAERGFEFLKNGASAVDAVTEAVVLMEDSGLFNAGAGSALNFEGCFEMEASVMDGKTLGVGAVGLVKQCEEPRSSGKACDGADRPRFRRGQRRRSVGTGIQIGKAKHAYINETCPI